MKVRHCENMIENGSVRICVKIGSSEQQGLYFQQNAFQATRRRGEEKWVLSLDSSRALPDAREFLFVAQSSLKQESIIL